MSDNQIKNLSNESLEQKIAVRLFSSLVPSLCCLTFIYISSSLINNPGLYYDELIFVNGALGGINSDLFIHQKIFNIPVMLMPYLGALKSWIYYPIFSFFGISEISIRFPMILLGAATLFLNFKLISKAFDKTTAIIFSILACVEPSTIFHTALDWGPTTLMLFIRSLVVFSAFFWIKTGYQRYFWTFIAFSLLGIFDKLSFSWIPTASLLSLAVVYPRNLTTHIKAIINDYNPKIFFILSIIITSGLIILLKESGIIQLVTSSETSRISYDIISRFHYLLNLLVQILGGEDVNNFVTNKQLHSSHWLYLTVLYSLLLSSIGILVGLKNNYIDKKSFIFFLVFFLILFVEVLFTKLATRPHHLSVLTPAWLIFISLGLSSIINFTNATQKISWGIGITSVCLICLITTSLKVNFEGLENMKSNSKPRWDKGNKFVAIEAASLNKRIVAIDWGIATIVQAYAQDRIKVFDFWPWFYDGIEGGRLSWFESEFIEKPTIFLVPAPGKEEHTKSLDSFNELNKKWKLTIKKIVRNSRGEPFYLIYETNN